MDIEKVDEELEKSYNRRYKSVEKRISSAVQHVVDEKLLDLEKIELGQMREFVTTMLTLETKSLQDDVESLLAQKEILERSLEKKHRQLQDVKYEVFDALESKFKDKDSALSKLHQTKLQSIDLYDILSEMVESALITALEKDTDGDIKESITELTKEITFEAIKEGSLSTIRVRKILSTILNSAIDVAEATPNRADNILGATLRGMRGGLIQSITRFKKRLAFTPVEAKHILVEDYDTIIEDLNQTDTLFSQVVINQASQSAQNIRKILLNVNKEMRYDLEELVHISKDAAAAMKDKFYDFTKTATKKADTAFKSEKAQEAKRMGKEVWGVAKVALDNAMKSAKNVMDKKEK